jgi:hypothetical protein
MSRNHAEHYWRAARAFGPTGHLALRSCPKRLQAFAVFPSSIFHLPSSIFHLPSSIFHLPSSIFQHPTSNIQHPTSNIQNAKKTSSTQQVVENQLFQQQQKKKLPITAGIISCPPESINTVRSMNFITQRLILIILGIVAVTIVAVAWIWSSHNRYYMMVGDKGIAYEVDRKTGETWVLRGGEKTKQVNPDEHRKEEQPLPSYERSKVTGDGGLSYGSFSGKIYNGSNWHITRVVITVDAQEEDGTSRWTRDFSDDLKIAPLATDSFYITVTGDSGVKKAPWAIKEVYGHP